MRSGVDRRTFVLGSTALSLSLGGAQAQADFPARLVKLIVPVPPGAQLDAVARVLAESLSAKWGRPVIVENRPGAGGNLGAEVVAKSAPDGYTLLVTHPGPLVANQWLYPKLSFDPNSLVPITVLVKLPPVLVAKASLPVTDFREFLAYARANPHKVTYGSPGAGSTPHLAMEELAHAAGVQLVHVPYQGVAPAQRDLLGGHIDVMIDMAGNALAQIRDGRIRALGVTGEARLAGLADVPPISETLASFAFTDWFAVAAPPKTSPALADQLSQSFAAALREPGVTRRMREFEALPVGNSPAEAEAFFRRESERWRGAIETARIRLE
jgi:tripartite-type tricarboxylate transporter receptor subunit TctC